MDVYALVNFNGRMGEFEPPDSLLDHRINMMCVLLFINFQREAEVSGPYVSPLGHHMSQ